MTEAAPTPADLIERLRIKLGEPGRPLSDDRLAQMVDAPTRQQVIGWRKHGKGMSRKYAERFARLDGEHTADDYMTTDPQVILGGHAIARRLDSIEAALTALTKTSELRERADGARVDQMLELVAEQLASQSALLEQLAAVAARLEAAAPPRSRRRAGGSPAPPT